MSATDELRSLLDERGVEHEDKHTESAPGVSDWDSTWWRGIAGLEFHAVGDETYGREGCVYINGTYLTPEQAVAATLEREINGETSDGYHTFNELYHHRAVLFSVIVRDHRELAWKARKHHDGTMYDGMFIVGIETPAGQATYHYDLDPYWDMFDCEEREAAPEWDGHTPDEAIARIATLGGEREKALEALVRDACWLIMRAEWPIAPMGEVASDWYVRMHDLGIEVDA